MYLVILAVTNLAMLLAQQTTPDSFGGWITLINIGLAGIGLVAFVKGWIVPGGIYNQTLAREQTHLEELKSLREVLEKQIIPEMVKSRESAKEMVSLTEDFLKLVKQTQQGTGQ